jgi:MtrB/PioB family decaheme-associated outer membrane protein
MTMKPLIGCVVLLTATTAFAQTQPAKPAANAPSEARMQVSGSVTSGVDQVTNDSNSSKFTEYRDLSDKYYLSHMRFAVAGPAVGAYLNLSAVNVGRTDQTVFGEAGRAGQWSLRGAWVETPHNFSNKAVTPYIQRSPGVFGVPATVPITFKKLATGAADAPSVVASDALIATYQQTFLAPTALGTQNNEGRFAFAWTGADALRLDIGFMRRLNTGLKSTYGPIGDRPPRTLNIQLTEPVDYRTNEVLLAAEHKGSGYQLRAEYLFSDFANQIDTLRWQNVYATTTPGATADTWDRSVGTWGAKPLAPDNRYHNAQLSGGLDLAAGRLTAAVGVGRLEQDQSLLPYSTLNNPVVNVALPRSTAQGAITTTSISADYVTSLGARSTVRAFFRNFDLANNTPESRWSYATQDTANLNGTSSFVNKRVSVPYAWERQNLGGDITWRLSKGRGALTAGYEREAITRVHREADTIEQSFKVTARLRPANGVSLQGRYLYGQRDGSDYHNQVTREGYWYTLSDGDNNNPQLTFDNHPDMRRFDVSDRARQQVDVRLTVSPKGAFVLSAFARYRADDFDSAVTSSQPLLDTTLADRLATSPGTQLGLLDDARTRVGMDLFVEAGPRASFNAFLAFDKGTSSQRGLEFNENNKANPSTIATASLGPWTRASNQWTSDVDDRTKSGGIGTTLTLVPERLHLFADANWSLATQAMAYAGFGVTNFDGALFATNSEFAFSSPPNVVEDMKTVNVRIELPFHNMVFTAGYLYEDYKMDDWQQSASQLWVEPVGADTLLRDTSRSHQWGNRLFNLGTYLAPSYTAHVGFVGLRVKF